MIDIDGRYFKIDLDALINWVTETPSSERNISTTTTITYAVTDAITDDTDIAEKEISENKTTLNDTMNNIRYDLIRNLLNALLITEGDDLINLSNLTLGQKLVFNSLLAKNIITEIVNQ